MSLGKVVLANRQNTRKRAKMVKRSYHFHIGAHEIYQTLVSDAFSALADEMSNAKVGIVDPIIFRSEIRPLLQGKPQSATRHISELKIDRSLERIVLSAHGVVCGKKEIFSDNGLYARNEPFLSGIASLFEGEDVTLHLAIVPQHDFRPVADSISSATQDISWIPFIDEIQEKNPNAKLVVWPIEKSVEESVEFLEGVCGLSIPRSKRQGIRQMARSQRVQAPEVVRESTDIVSTYMDYMFHQDMEILAWSSEAAIGIKRIRDEFSIS